MRLSPRRRAARHVRRIARIFLAIIAVFVAAELFGVRVITSPSVPPGLWWIHGTPRVDRGAFVVTCLPEPIALAGRERGYLAPGPCAGNAQALLKRVLAIPGDTVCVDSLSERVRAAGTTTIVPNSARHELDERGRPVPTFVSLGCHLIAKNTVWLTGDGNALSWDSRYWGALPQAVLQHAAYPRGTIRPISTTNALGIQS